MTPATTPAVPPAPWELEPALAERLTGGRWLGGRTPLQLQGAALDSRAVRPGCIFACVRGERVDGHDFAATAVGAGASLVLATRALALPAPVLVVADVAAALLALAGELRRRLAQTRWIAVAGSNGKTTTKALLAAACAGGGALVHATPGNLNNHLGVPLSVLATPADAAYAVIEIGANHPGEVAVLAAAVQPQVGVVTSFGPEHLEGFGGLRGVVESECELLGQLPLGAPAFVGLHGFAVHCRDHGMRLDATISRILELANRQRLALALIDDASHPTGMCEAVPGADQGDGVRLDTPAGSALVGLLGAHNRANAWLAWRTAVAAGVAPSDALRGLARAAPVAGRLVPRRCGAHLLLDDTYNANPASMIAGLRVLAARPGRRLAVLGAMGELGADSEAGHRRVGAEAAALGLSVVAVGAQADGIAAGSRAAGGSAEVADDCADAVRRTRAFLAAGGAATVLVKASRSQRLERVVEGLLAAEAAC
ncbi:MAG: UDP-N-acetylmuramoyl-tripeptide--D-alanyl-D-alanine ligase [Planctomycetes bacterium]|nr:UDP-N-acetylmuramoyl-tripeptide--D-alanyl-D-alanine ligase [Planctomycetota bacterium]